MKTKSNMKTKSVVSALCALLGFAVLADSYTFTAGEVIPLKSGENLASYVTLYDASGNNLKANTYSLDSTQSGDSLTLSLYNQTAGNYVLSLLGSAGGFDTNPTLEVKGVTDASYEKNVTLTQRNTGTNINDTDPYAYNSNNGKAQTTLVALDNLPQGEFTLKLNIVRSWGGNYGYFTFYNVDDAVSSVALDLQSDNGNTVTVASNGTAAPYVKMSGAQFEGSGAQTAIGSVSNNGYIQFSLYCPTTGTCAFSYQSGSKNASTMTWTLAKGDGTQVYTESDAIESHDNWTLSDNHSHDFGLLSAGYYVLKGLCAGSATYNGNFGNFTFDFVEYIEKDITEDYKLPDGAKVTVTSIANGVTIDLNGNDLSIASSCTFAGVAYFTNSVDATLSTLTIDSPINKNIVLGGNLRYVYTGAGGANGYFRSTADKINDATVANTHTGGTVISNITNQIRYFSPDNFGSGPIVMANASMMRPSSNLGDGNFSNPWEFYGENFMEVQNWANNTGSVNLKGPWSGDGFIHIQNGWVPTIELNGDMAEFTGTLEIAYKDNASAGFWMRGDNTNGLPRATLKLANVSGVTDAEKRLTHLKIKPGNNATVTHTDNITAFPIGHLVTDGDDPDDFANSYIMNCQQWANSTWEIGALNESGTFAGWFTQEAANAHLAITKVGTGTWTLTSSLHTFDGPLTVAAGRLNINSANLTNCAIVVKSGATLGGTGTLSDKASVTVEGGGILAGSLTFNAGVTFASGAVFDGDETAAITGDVNLAGTVVDVDDVSAVTDGHEFLTVTGTATGKPSVSAALAAVSKHNGKHGKWIVDVATADGVTTYSLVWRPTGLVIIVR